MLWISADPGCGKSVLTRFLIEDEFHLTNTHTACYFFFKDNEEQSSLSTALCALLHQLFSSRPSLILHAMDAFKQDAEKFQKETDKLWGIFKTAATDSGAGSITCIIDALDECRVEDRRKFINFLTQFHLEGANSVRGFHLKFLVTSRPYQDIELEFNDIPEPQSIRLTGEDSNADISQEIDFVIRDRVKQVGRKLNMSSEVQQALQEKLLAVQHRTYLWLHLVMQEVEHSLRKTTKAFLQKTSSLPTTVEDAYEKILGRLKKSQRGDAEILLHLVVSARRPLTLSEMDVAFQLATDTPNAQKHDDLELDEDRLKSEIRQICGLFVFINDGRIYLIHQTAKEFLVAKGGACGSASTWKGSLCRQRSDTIMMQVCARYLLFRDIQPDWHLFEKDRIEISAQKYPLIDYAAKHWPAHARGVNLGDETTQNLIYELYNAEESSSGSCWYIQAYADGRERYFDEPIQKVHVAALNAHSSVLSKLLLRDMTCLEAKDKHGRTPLFMACQSGNSGIVQILLDKGADVNSRASSLRHTKPLQVATRGGHSRIVQMLLNKGADVNAKDRGDDGNALQVAASNGYIDIVRMLLEKGADSNADSDSWTGTALTAASYRGSIEIIQILLDKGADIDAVGSDLFGTALVAAVCNGSIGLVQMLLDKGADVNAVGGNQYGTALIAASFIGSMEIVRMLLNKGSDVNAVVSNGHGTALISASFNGYVEIVQMLLDKGANVNTGGGFFGKAFRAASFKGQIEIMQMLLNKGIDPAM